MPVVKRLSCEAPTFEFWVQILAGMLSLPVGLGVSYNWMIMPLS